MLLDPESRLLPVVEICKRAKVSKDTYYAAFRREAFRKLYQDEALNIIRRSVAPMANSMVREAVRGSAQHQKMAFEMADMLKTKVTHEAGESFEDMLRRLRGLPPVGSEGKG